MKISHKTVNVSGTDYIYIYITVEDIYEFGKENLGKGGNSSLLKNLREYVKNNMTSLKKAGLVIVINGVVIGSMTLSALLPEKTKDIDSVASNKNQVIVYEEKSDENLENNDKLKEEKVEETTKEETDEKVIVKDVVVKEEKKETNKVTTTNKVNTNTSNKVNSSNQTTKPSTIKPSNTQTTTDNTQVSTKPNTTKPTTSKPSSNTQPTTQSGIKIKLNNAGVISSIDLEEYVMGVVAAEMPASFSLEALKAQAVAARTYAMKKHSKGITLLNSTAHQVYNTEAQMRAKWGSAYSTYYNKIKSAVNATKGKVLKYNGEYIEASYYAISNGYSELPKYVWNTEYPYLKAVSSSWDKGISAGKHSVNMTYDALSSKLGVTVNKDTEIKVLSKTEGNRVSSIKIGDKTFTGVKVRSLLGLRSADFEITKKDTGVVISETGYGHGVGMSQYGANGAAKAGYTYTQILSHYYPGTSLVTI